MIPFTTTVAGFLLGVACVCFAFPLSAAHRATATTVVTTTVANVRAVVIANPLSFVAAGSAAAIYSLPYLPTVVFAPPSAAAIPYAAAIGGAALILFLLYVLALASPTANSPEIEQPKDPAAYKKPGASQAASVIRQMDRNVAIQEIHVGNNATLSEKAKIVLHVHPKSSTPAQAPAPTLIEPKVQQPKVPTQPKAQAQPKQPKAQPMVQAQPKGQTRPSGQTQQQQAPKDQAQPPKGKGQPIELVQQLRVVTRPDGAIVITNGEKAMDSIVPPPSPAVYSDYTNSSPEFAAALANVPQEVARLGIKNMGGALSTFTPVTTNGSNLCALAAVLMALGLADTVPQVQILARALVYTAAGVLSLYDRNPDLFIMLFLGAIVGHAPAAGSIKPTNSAFPNAYIWASQTKDAGGGGDPRLNPKVEATAFINRIRSFVTNWAPFSANQTTTPAALTNIDIVFFLMSVAFHRIPLGIACVGGAETIICLSMGIKVDSITAMIINPGAASLHFSALAKATARHAISLSAPMPSRVAMWWAHAFLLADNRKFAVFNVETAAKAVGKAGGLELPFLLTPAKAPAPKGDEGKAGGSNKDSDANAGKASAAAAAMAEAVVVSDDDDEDDKPINVSDSSGEESLASLKEGEAAAAAADAASIAAELAEGASGRGRASSRPAQPQPRTRSKSAAAKAKPASAPASQKA